MILDHRTYTLVPQGLGEFYKLYEAEGFPVQSKILGRLIAGHRVRKRPERRTNLKNLRRSHTQRRQRSPQC